MQKSVLVGIDRDGTIIKDADFLGRNENWKVEVQVLPGAVEGIRKLKSYPEILAIVASNQSGVARGYFDEKRIQEINEHINALLKKEDADIKKWYFCPFVEKAYGEKYKLAADNPYVKETHYRKPGIGMLQQAAIDHSLKLEDFVSVWFVGDKLADVETGLNANGNGIYIPSEKEAKDKPKVEELMKKRPGRVFIAKDLSEAADIILDSIYKKAA
jgi:D-glycero-D-manno-heptose 1,7-bisphosphate phosphatase